MKKTTSGFTIIELLTVIIIITIMTALGLFSFLSVQVKSRDSQRSSKITLIANSLEKYFSLNGEYPSCANMADTASNIVANTLKDAKVDIFATPTAPANSNSILSGCTDMPAGYALDKFAYVGISSTNCLNTPCREWTLKYREESTGNIISTPSHNKLSY